MTHYTTRAEGLAYALSDPDACHAVQPGTLGYQMCQKPSGHKGKHRSQDGKTYQRETAK